VKIGGKYPFYIGRKYPQLHVVVRDLLKKCEGVCT